LLNIFAAAKNRQGVAEMKHFRSSRRKSRLGFSLIEAAFSVGILGFGFLSLAPVLGLGLDSARAARDRQIGAQIAETLADAAREGALPAGPSSFDDRGGVCAPAGAQFEATTIETALPGNCTRVTIQVVPVDAPGRPLDYAVVLPNS
jgi:Tfp pilus assembly protein PilV